MKACPFCAEDIQDAAIVCKHCGRDLAASPAAAVPPPTSKAARVMSLGCLGIVGLVVLLGVIGGSGRSGPTPDHTTTDAFLVCRQFVRQRLRAPATADFPPSVANDVSSVHQGGGVYLITAYVDSQNGFGAMIRSAFTCKVEWQSGEKYRLLDLTMTP